MGLDNSIVLKIKDKEKFGGDRLPSWMPRADWEDEGNYPWEILYWRKCWNIREVIFEHLIENKIKVCDDCSFDMPMPLDVFWTWKDIEKTGYHQERLALAMRLVGWLETKDPESYEISFYDSY